MTAIEKRVLDAHRELDAAHRDGRAALRRTEVAELELFQALTELRAAEGRS